MRMIRSFFFGGFAMLAAVMFLSAPASASGYDPGVYASPFELYVVGTVPDPAPAAVIAEAERLPAPSMNRDAIAYASQNQPHTSWRFAVDAYSRIDPHILAV
ncbi:hypothetical protein JYP46_19230 [Nitratireductor aquimarinus]|uniref:hypothetical protein n=1 Tax=Alphaproteobacteria TaxID=28211 RepID=UPI0019D3557F|nr:MULTISPECIES: hypothetical protein [Alphaproteobacteria]MBN7758965.1 hypothetical protein [Nitratireductor aquimarinus]MBY6001638.1 hypothetical protein [Tritonibacter mobilis]MBY6023926.1 hypothetical protein [Nitratireductor sp. DP7N14-4]